MLVIDVSCFVWWEKATIICMVVLQNSMDVVEGETGNSSGTGVTCDDGTEEVSMKLEDAIDIKEEFTITFEDALNIKNEIPEAITFTPVKTELEVRLWGVCVWWWQLVLSGHLLPERMICILCSNTSII
jgi:hypothetical protein